MTLTGDPGPDQYPICWQVRFLRAVNALPVPNPIVYLFLFAAVTFANHLVPWIQGYLPWGQLDPQQFNFLIWFLVVLLAGDYFLTYSRSSLVRFRPALDVDQETFDRIAYHFLYPKASTGWWFTLLATAMSPAWLKFGPRYMQSGVGAAMLLVSSALMFSLVLMFLYYLLRSLVLIRRLYGRIGAVNVYHLTPLYALSGFTSRVGIFFVGASTLSYLTNVSFSETPQFGPFLLFGSVNLITAVIAFVYPLLGIHDRLAQEIEQARAENGRQLQAAQRRLHRKVEQGDEVGYSETKDSITSLLDLRHELGRLSPWPWDTGTIRSFLTALLVPIALWIIQAFLAKALHL